MAKPTWVPGQNGTCSNEHCSGSEMKKENAFMFVVVHEWATCSLHEWVTAVHEWSNVDMYARFPYVCHGCVFGRMFSTMGIAVFYGNSTSFLTCRKKKNEPVLFWGLALQDFFSRTTKDEKQTFKECLRTSELWDIFGHPCWASIRATSVNAWHVFMQWFL